MPGNVAYCVSKGGTRMLTRTAGVELGPHGIQVVNIAPGAVATPINPSTMGDPAKLKTLDAAIPIGRMAEPDEIAASSSSWPPAKAAYMTATTVFVDGGIMQGSVGLSTSIRSGCARDRPDDQHRWRGHSAAVSLLSGARSDGFRCTAMTGRPGDGCGGGHIRPSASGTAPRGGIYGAVVTAAVLAAGRHDAVHGGVGRGRPGPPDRVLGSGAVRRTAR